SADYTLTLMTWVAVVFLPLVLGYQAWSYWVFRKRVTGEQITGATVTAERGEPDQAA
ncbi:MAG: cytochrome d ubiquinol oxidase subunit II, partial [Nocardiopsis sp. BM-2018]